MSTHSALWKISCFSYNSWLWHRVETSVCWCETDVRTENETAVLQLGVEGSHLVLHIYHMSEMPRSRFWGVKISCGKSEAASIKTPRNSQDKPVRFGLQRISGHPTYGDFLGLQKFGLKALSERFNSQSGRCRTNLEKISFTANGDWIRCSGCLGWIENLPRDESHWNLHVTWEDRNRSFGFVYFVLFSLLSFYFLFLVLLSFTSYVQ